jgi:hypothetical protein
MANVRETARNRIRTRVSLLTSGQIASARRLNPFFDFIRESRTEAFLFGGTLRDFALNRKFKAPRDLDIVIGTDLQPIVQFFSRQNLTEGDNPTSDLAIRRNRFGGLKVKLYGHSIDIWQMQDTWAFKERLVLPVRFERLPRTTFLNLDAVALELFPTGNRRTRRFFEHDFLSGVERETIEINLLDNPSPPLCVIRSIILADSTGFRIGPKLANFLRHVAQNMTLAEFEAIQRSHFGTVRRSIHELQVAAEKIEKILSRGAGHNIELTNVQFDFDTWIKNGHSKPESANLSDGLDAAWKTFRRTVSSALQGCFRLFG